MKPIDLANKLFDMALVQFKSDPREAARQCIIFLTEALVYAISSMPREAAPQCIIFLTEALIYAISSTAPDENARKAQLKSVGEAIINAPPLPPSPLRAK